MCQLFWTDHTPAILKDFRLDFMPGGQVSNSVSSLDSEISRERLLIQLENKPLKNIFGGLRFGIKEILSNLKHNKLAKLP